MSYTLKQTINSAIGKVVKIGDNIYFSEGDVIYEYDMMGDTLTDISGSTFSDAGGLNTGPEVLGSDLYALSTDNTAKVSQVWKWAGGTSWSSVFSYDFSTVSGGGVNWFDTFAANDDALFYIGSNGFLEFYSGSEFVAKYSTNGAGWNTTSVNISSTPSFTPDTSISGTVVFKWQANYFLQPTCAGSFGLLASPFTHGQFIFQWNGSAFAEIMYAEADSPYSSWTPNNCPQLWGSAGSWPNDNWIDIMFMGSNQDYEDAAAPSCTYDSWGATEFAVYSLGFENTGLKAFGARNQTPGTNWYAVAADGSYTWESPGEFIASSERPRWAVRRSDGLVLAILTSAGLGVNKFYLGTTAYADLGPAFTHSSGAIPGSILVTT